MYLPSNCVISRIIQSASQIHIILKIWKILDRIRWTDHDCFSISNHIQVKGCLDGVSTDWGDKGSFLCYLLCLQMKAHQWKMQTVINRDTEREEEMKKRQTERNCIAVLVGWQARRLCAVLIRNKRHIWSALQPTMLALLEDY